VHLKNIIWILVALSASFVAADVENILWDVPYTDTTYQYLTFLFGTVSEDLTCSSGGCSILIPQIFRLFNQSLLTIGSMVMTFVMMTSTGTSAHEGEFLGKKGSSLLMPLRIMTGVSFLVPTSTGYSVLQVFMMKVILMGVALANGLYTTVGTYVKDNDRTFAKETTSVQGNALLLHDMVNLAEQIFNREVCYIVFRYKVPFNSDMIHKLNQHSADTLSLGPTQQNCDEKFFGYQYTVDRIVENDRTVNSGCDFQANKKDLCGSWKYYYASNDTNQTKTKTVLETLTLDLRTAAEHFVSHWHPGEGMPIPDMNHKGSVKDNKAEIDGVIVKGIMEFSKLRVDQAPEVGEASDFKGDWMDFPKDFYKWIDKGSGAAITLGSIKSEAGVAGGHKGMKHGPRRYIEMRKNLNHMYNFFDEDRISEALGGDTMKLKAPKGTGGPVAYMYTTLKGMVKGDAEPLISLAIFGQTMLKIAIDMLLTSILVGGVMVMVSAVCASVQNSFAFGMTSAFVGFLISLMTAFGFLIPMGVALGIYLPLIPGMTYCSGVIVWYMMVIETMVAGPIIALGMISPSQETLGKSQGAILMLLNVFLRPSLMVMGMVFGAKMFDLFAIYFSNIMMNGFDFIGKKAGFDAWYGVVFFVFWFFYAFSIVGIAQRCYALIYILPDKVISWVGGQSSGSGQEIQHDLQAMKAGSDKGGDAMKQEMSNVSSGLGKLNESVMAMKTKE